MSHPAAWAQQRDPAPQPVELDGTAGVVDLSVVRPQRPRRTRAAPPVTNRRIEARVAARVENRLSTRIQLRLDRSADQTSGRTRAIEDADARARSTSRATTRSRPR